MILVLTLAGLVGLVSAQTGSPPEPATDASTTIEALHQELARRDALIVDLLRRVEKLERQVSSMVAAAASRPAAGPSADLQPREQSDGGSSNTLAGVQPAATPHSAEAPDAPVPVPKPAASQTAKVETAPAAPGQFEVDEEAIDRALERTLVQTGVLLLPFGKAEITPAFSYTREETDSPVLLIAGDDTFTGQSEVRRNRFDFGLGLRVGLPFDAQLELNLPFQIVNQSTSRFPDQSEQEQTGSGLGDLSLGLAKTLLREGRWWPDLIGRFTWDSATGKRRDNGVILSGDFNEIRGSLTALKRQDPLAFVGGVSYQTAFEHDDIDPGDELGFSIGTVLAASPETSLRLSLSQTFVDEVKVDGRSIDGSDQVMSMLSLGAAVILGRGVLVDVSADVGLTDDAPDYAARIAVPILFDLPIPPPVW
jgi:hypothetical protein